jgi:hypothetical protein
MSIEFEDFSGYLADSFPSILGEELWDGQYDNRFISNIDGAFRNDPSARTTKAIAVTGGKAYRFSGNDRCRVRWHDSSDNLIHAIFDTDISPKIWIAPANAAYVYFYYTSTASTTCSVKEVYPGWGQAWVHTGVNYLVRANAGYEGGKALMSEMTGTTNARRGIAWSGKIAADFDLIGTVESTHQSATTTDTVNAGLFGRGSGGIATESMYIVLLRSIIGGTSVELVKYVNGSIETLATTVYSWNVNTKYYVRFQAIGTALKAKVWTGDIGDEPESWTLEATDSSITAAGWIGFFNFYSASSSHRYTYDLIQDYDYSSATDATINAITGEVNLIGLLGDILTISDIVTLDGIIGNIVIIGKQGDITGGIGADVAAKFGLIDLQGLSGDIFGGIGAIIDAQTGDVVLIGQTANITGGLSAIVSAKTGDITIVGDPADITGGFSADVSAKTGDISIEGNKGNILGGISASIDGITGNIAISGLMGFAAGGLGATVDALAGDIIINGKVADISGGISAIIDAVSGDITLTGLISDVTGGVSANIEGLIGNVIIKGVESDVIGGVSANVDAATGDIIITGLTDSVYEHIVVLVKQPTQFIVKDSSTRAEVKSSKTRAEVKSSETKAVIE